MLVWTALRRPTQARKGSALGPNRFRERHIQFDRKRRSAITMLFRRLRTDLRIIDTWHAAVLA
jgi:hypothetical protein